MRQMFSTLCFILTFIVIVTSLKEPGTCDKPCTGGPYDLCVKCPTPCPKTCAKTKSQICPTYCLANGCECAPGYLRENGRCILPDQCPKNNTSLCKNCDGRNKKCARCFDGCEKTCQGILNPSTPVGPCLISCGGYYCLCADNYYLGDDGECVSAENCIFHTEMEPPVLPAPTPNCDRPCTGGIHDNCVLCGTKCPLTCENYNSPPICTKDCVPDVCQCDKGYVRTSGGRCVRPGKCPAKKSMCDKRKKYY